MPRGSSFCTVTRVLGASRIDRPSTVALRRAALKAELQPLWPSLAAGESLHPQRLCTIGAQADPVVLQQQHAHLRLAAAGQRHR